MNNIKQINIRNCVVFFLALGFSFSCFAQTAQTTKTPETKQDTTDTKQRKNLNENVVITTYFDPEVNEADKMFESPSIFEAEYVVPKFDYSINNTLIPTDFTITPIRVAKVRAKKIEPPYNAYISAGIGTYLTPYLEAAYSNAGKNNFLFSSYIKHYSSNWTSGNYAKNHFANNDIELYIKKVGKKSMFDASLYYNNASGYYSGFNNDSLQLDDDNFKTAWHNIGLEAEYKSMYKNNKALHHSIGIGVEDLIGRWGTNELTLNFNANFNKNLSFSNYNKQKIGLRLDFTQYINKYDLNQINAYPYFDTITDLNNLTLTNKNTTSLLNIEPYLDFKMKSVDLAIYLKMVALFGTESGFYFVPKATIGIDVFPRKAKIIAGVEADANRPTINQLRQENPYISPILDYIKPSANYDFFARLELLPISSLQINLQFGYEMFSNKYFYTIDSLASLDNMFNLVYSKANRFYVWFNAKYDLDTRMQIALDMQYQKYNVLDINSAYYTPGFMASLDFRYNINEQFFVSLTPTFKSSTTALYLGQEITLKPIIDINLYAEYRHNKTVSFFAKLNNLAFQRYEQYHRYPSQGFMAMGGIKMSF